MLEDEFGAEGPEVGNEIYTAFIAEGRWQEVERIPSENQNAGELIEG